MTDYIHFLPTDDNPINPVEKQVFANILNSNTSSTQLHSFINELKQPLLVGIVFMLLNTEQSNTLIESVVGYARSSKTSLLLFKTFLFIVIYFVWQNIAITQNN